MPPEITITLLDLTAYMVIGFVFASIAIKFTGEYDHPTPTFLVAMLAWPLVAGASAVIIFCWIVWKPIDWYVTKVLKKKKGEPDYGR